MKKLFLTMFSMLALVAVTFGQAEDALKAAQKGLNKYYQNPADNLDKLTEGVDLLKTAFESDAVKGMASAWLTKGKIFSEIASSEFKSKTLDPSYVIKQPAAAAMAYEAFGKVMGMSDKKGDIKDAKSGMAETENHLNNAAIFAYQAKDYANAFTNFKASLDAHKSLTDAGQKSRLSEDALYNDQVFFTAVSAYYGEDLSGAKPYFQKLAEMGREEPLVYEALYKIGVSEKDPNAADHLAAGREKFPDDTGLLFQEINHYLAAGQLEKLISKLETAIEKEPGNSTVHTTLGNVYDQLAVQEAEKGNSAKSSEYFQSAVGKYNDALSKDEGNFDATYSLGALYYNKAASMVEELNDLGSDITPAGMKKYDSKKAEMDGLFNSALPFFLKAEGLNGSDGNTIIALKEIYARLNDLTKSAEYKAKYDKLSGGE